MIYPEHFYKTCPRCENDEIQDEHGFCFICGAALKNECTGNNFCTVSLKNNARYCPVCGEKTTYFAAGFLKPWNVEKDELKNYEEELPF